MGSDITDVQRRTFEILDTMTEREVVDYMGKSKDNAAEVMLYFQSLARGDHYYESNRKPDRRN